MSRHGNSTGSTRLCKLQSCRRTTSCPFEMHMTSFPFIRFNRHRGSSSAPQPQPSAKQMALNIPIAVRPLRLAKFPLPLPRMPFRAPVAQRHSAKRHPVDPIDQLANVFLIRVEPKLTPDRFRRITPPPVRADSLERALRHPPEAANQQSPSPPPRRFRITFSCRRADSGCDERAARFSKECET